MLAGPPDRHLETLAILGEVLVLNGQQYAAATPRRDGDSDRDGLGLAAGSPSSGRDGVAHVLLVAVAGVDRPQEAMK